MMRSQHGATPHRSGKQAIASPALGIQCGLFTPSARDSSRALFAPLHYEPNYAYPLIVWLHGPGCDEFQLVRIMPHVSMRNYVAVAPRGLPIGGPGGEAGTLGWLQRPDHVQEAEQRIFDGIEAAEQKYNVAPHRVFLAGVDCGGTMALRVAMNHPRRFRGVLTLGGAFPSGQTPLSQWVQARHLSVFLALGRESREYPPEKACEDLRLFHAAGMSVMLRQYPCAQQLTSEMLGDMDRWIMEQITGPSPSRAKAGDRSPCSPEG